MAASICIHTSAAALRRLLHSSSAVAAVIPKNLAINPSLASSPSISLSLSLLNSRRRKKLLKKLNSPRLRPITKPAVAVAFLDSVLSRDAEFRFLTRARHYLAALPSASLPLSVAGKLHRELGFPRGRRVSRFAALHPLLFSLNPKPAGGDSGSSYNVTLNKSDADGICQNSSENNCHVQSHQTKLVPSLSLTPLMLTLLAEECEIADAAEQRRIATLRKLLMIASGHRIPLSKLHHCRLIFGFPADLRDRVCKYPQFFRIAIDSADNNRHVLELEKWDPTLAVSAIEKLYISDEQRARRLFSFNIPHSKYLELDEDSSRQLKTVSTLPLISPYSDGSEYEPWTVDAEKYRVGVLHEFLSLTLEKRASIHHIMEFKEELCLTRHTYQMLVKQPRAFYLSGTAMNWDVFLLEAYDEQGNLIEKDPQLLFEEKLRQYARMTQKDLQRE